MNIKPAFDMGETVTRSSDAPVVHEIPLSVILMNIVDYQKITHLPANQDCTQLLKSACLRVLDHMYPKGAHSIEEFIAHRARFMNLFRAEIVAHGRGMWKSYSSDYIELRIVNPAGGQLRFA